MKKKEGCFERICLKILHYIIIGQENKQKKLLTLHGCYYVVILQKQWHQIVF
jgi:hypothetical protein